MTVVHIDIPEPVPPAYEELERAGHAAGLPGAWFLPFGVMVGQLARALGKDRAVALVAELVEILPDG